MMTLNDLLEIPYVSGGRAVQGADCYGLVRIARVVLFDKPWMPLHGGLDPSDKRQVTRTVRSDSAGYRVCYPRPGAIAAAYRGRLCTHVALVVDVDGRMMVLETDNPDQGRQGPRLTPLRQFEQRYLQVVYYDD